jgi:hypothetical protein
MNEMERQALVAAYWHHFVSAHVQNDQAEGDRWLWAWEAVDATGLDGEASAVELMLALAEACHSSQGLAYLGAGPVEDLVKHGDEALLEHLLGAAERSGRLRRALATISINDKSKSKRLRQFFRDHPPLLPAGVVDNAHGP